MKKSIFILLFALLGIFSAHAYDFKVDGIYYNQIKLMHKVSVTSGPVKYSGSVVIPATVTYNGIIYAVTSIESDAFKGCSGLTSVTIPEGVTSIGESAFRGCSGLISVTIPESVTEIKEYAFYGCTSISSPLYNSKIFAYMPQNYSGKYEIPSGIQTIMDRAFTKCTGLTSVTIPESVTSIGEYAFNSCSSLTSVEWNAVACKGNVFYHGADNSMYEHYSPFYNCKNITSITFGEYVERIPSYLCYGMKNLTSVTIGESVTYIGVCAFWGCTGLTSVTIPNSIIHIGEYAFNSCTGLTSVTIPNSVTLISEGAFNNCTGLTSVTIPNSVTLISKGAFNNCTGLTSVEWNAVACQISYDYYYGRSVFYNCNITTITFGNQVEHIPSYLGDEMYGLRSVTSLAETPPSCGSSVFAVHDTLLVPRGSKEAYQTAQEWSKFTTIYEFGVDGTGLVTVQPNDTTMGRVTGGGEYKIGEQVTIEAISNQGYHFVKWDDGSTDNPRTLTVRVDITLTAVFAENTYTVTVQPNDAAMGTVTGGGEYKEGEQATLTAIPNEGYHFIKWSDENTDNPRMLMVTEDITLTAIFAKEGEYPTANENPATDNFRVYAQNRTIHLSEYRGLVQVYNVAGQCIYNGRATAIPVPQSGVYIVAVGSQRFKVLVR